MHAHAHSRCRISPLLATCPHVSCRPELAWRQHGDSQPMARCKRRASCKMRARASGDRVDGERGGACGVAKRRCVHSARLEGRAALDSEALPRKGPRASTAAGPSRESDCEPQFTVNLAGGDSVRQSRRPTSTLSDSEPGCSGIKLSARRSHNAHAARLQLLGLGHAFHVICGMAHSHFQV